jgi:putative restriction endonuclease
MMLAENAGVPAERSRRWRMWEQLVDARGPQGVQPGLLRELGIYGGAQGIWVDKQQTQAAAPGTGVAVGLLHTGSAYADDLADDGVIYHYPATSRRGKDEAEIAAVKAAGETPAARVFVIIYSGPGLTRRDVRLGWVEGGWRPSALLQVSSLGSNKMGTSI